MQTDVGSQKTPVELASDEPLRSPRLLRLLARFVFGIVILLACVAFVASRFRPELEALGTSFVDRFGLFGMALGTFIADGFHFPVPPQFYMLLGIAGGTSQTAVFLAVMCGSLIGGAAGFTVARYAARIPFIARWLARSARSVGSLFTKYSYRTVVIASLTPIAYSVLCYLAGIYHMPKRVLVILSLLRIPKLVLYYYLVRLGWTM